MIRNIVSSRGGVYHRPILRTEIEEAQRHTNSNAAAARWLKVSYKRYRKFAKLYDLFDRHLNQDGVGIDKGWSKRPTSIPLRDVLAGKHPKYSLAKLKNRLIARKKLHEKCTLCGFAERRITDQKVPLMLTFRDGIRTNFALDNLVLYCYNCMFLTTGAPSVVNRTSIERSLTHPEAIQRGIAPDMNIADAYDRADAEAEAALHAAAPLTIADIRALQAAAARAVAAALTQDAQELGLDA